MQSVYPERMKYLFEKLLLLSKGSKVINNSESNTPNTKAIQKVGFQFLVYAMVLFSEIVIWSNVSSWPENKLIQPFLKLKKENLVKR